MRPLQGDVVGAESTFTTAQVRRWEGLAIPALPLASLPLPSNRCLPTAASLPPLPCQAPSASATVRFAAIADQWVSSLGSVGTTERLVARIAAVPRDVEFVLHVGDLGYAKGAVWLWEEWMALCTAVAGSTAYMVSVGNHEYDYPTDAELDCGRPCGENDPSGAGESWRPAWWDGLVDSEGEVGGAGLLSPRGGGNPTVCAPAADCCSVASGPTRASGRRVVRAARAGTPYSGTRWVAANHVWSR